MSVETVPIQIAVRIRPLKTTEALQQPKATVIPLTSTKVGVGKSKKFTFHHVFGPDSTQRNVYTECVKPLVQHVFDGYNCTVMAYGQTGSGKTYTMGPSTGTVVSDTDLSLGDECADSVGILQRAVHAIFCMISDNGCSFDCTVSVSAVEIYMETVSDLLDPGRSGMQIRETQTGETVLLGATSVDVTTEADLSQTLLSAANVRR